MAVARERLGVFGRSIQTRLNSRACGREQLYRFRQGNGTTLTTFGQMTCEGQFSCRSQKRNAAAGRGQTKAKWDSALTDHGMPCCPAWNLPAEILLRSYAKRIAIPQEEKFK